MWGSRKPAKSGYLPTNNDQWLDQHLLLYQSHISQGAMMSNVHLRLVRSLYWLISVALGQAPLLKLALDPLTESVIAKSRVDAY